LPTEKRRKKINESEQKIGQNSTAAQASACDPLGDTTASCNNVALSFSLKEGNNAPGQQ
jgi:hypothetical protein